MNLTQSLCCFETNEYFQNLPRMKLFAEHYLLTCSEAFCAYWITQSVVMFCPIFYQSLQPPILFRINYSYYCQHVCLFGLKVVIFQYLVFSLITFFYWWQHELVDTLVDYSIIFRDWTDVFCDYATKDINPKIFQTCKNPEFRLVFETSCMFIDS